MKITKLIKNPYCIFSVLASRGWFDRMPDERFLRLQFRAQLGKWPDLEHPQTFNEKLQWLKLHDRRPEYTMMADKYRVREYIKEKIGEEYLIPLLGVWDDPDEIDFDALPEQFVLKCNHNSGKGLCICRDKSKLDIAKVKEELRLGLAQDYYLTGREWPYHDIPRKIICEKYMSDSADSDSFTDYKFMCFHGNPDCVMVCRERFKGKPKFYFFDRDWNFKRLEKGSADVPEDFTLPKPACMDQMFAAASKLSEGFAFVRVDLYQSDGHIYFGELTLYPDSGFDKDLFPETDACFGSLLHLNTERKTDHAE